GVVYERQEEAWAPRVRTLQYSLDYDPDFLLLANYIPLHTLLLPRALFERAGGFDRKLEYSEDWDFLIRLSFETSFRHLRAVTCEYRVFDRGDGDPGHAAAGSASFQEARRIIYERYRGRRDEEGLARTLDRLRAQVAFWYDRDRISQGELVYQRDSHRKLNASLFKAGERLGETEAALHAARGEAAALEAERARLSADLAAAQAHGADLAISNDGYRKAVAAMQ